MYDREFDRLSKAETNEIRRVTGCRKPCSYKKYKFIGEKEDTTSQSGEFTFSLWAVSELTMVHSEQLIYPLSSLVAELGGVLSLFLGFSFMTHWDVLYPRKYLKIVKRVFSCYKK